MITQLTIHNYALIDHLTLTLPVGLSVITGETGAGKSILLGALSLLLGGKPDAKSINTSTERTSIEGEFAIEHYPLESFFAENDLDYLPTCILRREITPAGRSRAFINDTPVSIAQLQELSSKLIDIHSQHQNLLIGDTLYQLRIIDTLARNQELSHSYRKHYKEWNRLKKELQKRCEESDRAHGDEAYLRYQLTELHDAQLIEEEEENLLEEQRIFTHAEEIKSELNNANNLLQEEERGILTLLQATQQRMSSLTRLYPAIEETSQRLYSNYIDLKDIAHEVEAAEEHIEVNPTRLKYIEERLNTLFTLQQKHRVTTTRQLIALQQEIEIQLANIDHSDEIIAQLEKEIIKEEKIAHTLAAELTQARTQAAQRFAPLMEELARPLGIPAIAFVVEITPKKEIDQTGGDEVAFTFSANKNRTPQPIAQIASGGEISRLMLCLKSLVAREMTLPSIIFDEIDSGVSGEIADKMGKIMQEMAHHMQVITITHLPQVAARGKQHYKVYKQHNDQNTYTRITQLSTDERIDELAQMLSGQERTQAAYENARELLQRTK